MNRLTEFERVIHRTEIWLERLDRERDAAMRAKPAQPNDAWKLWVDRLEAERRDTVALLEQLRVLQHRRPLLFRVRPSRMLYVPLHRSRVRKEA